MTTKDQIENLKPGTKQMSKKVQKAFHNNESLYYDRDDGVTVVASDITPDGYLVTYHKGEMPAFETNTFTSIIDVIDAMREIAPLTHWKIVRYE